jgi:hypothetical protein
MSPDTVLLVLIIGNPIAMVLVGIWCISLGKRIGRPYLEVIGKIACIAAPIFLIAGLLVLI